MKKTKISYDKKKDENGEKNLRLNIESNPPIVKINFEGKYSGL